MKRNDLTGKKIGRWTVGESFKKGNKIYYHCTCECGSQHDVYGSVLNRGKSLSCQKCWKIGTGDDLTGKDFGLLHVEENIVINNHTWCRCSCKCGGSTIVDPKNLRSGYVTTCGCRTGAGDRIREGISNYCIDGTYVPGLLRSGLNKNNTSGCTGVSFRADRGRWRAYIKFQRKDIFLGNFLKYEDAVAVRKIAEKEYFGKYLDQEVTK